MLDNGKCCCSRHVILVSSCLLYFMYLLKYMKYTLLPLRIRCSCSLFTLRMSSMFSPSCSGEAP